jgi:hypothetical protein
MYNLFVLKNLKNYMHDISWVITYEARFLVILATNYYGE